MKNIVISAIAALGLVMTATVQAEPSEKYNKSCAVCHNLGVAGAPKTGDVAAWEPRLVKGMDVLVASIRNGMNAMPPLGMCFDCSDEEYIELINYMAEPAE